MKQEGNTGDVMRNPIEPIFAWRITREKAREIYRIAKPYLLLRLDEAEKVFGKQNN